MKRPRSSRQDLIALDRAREFELHRIGDELVPVTRQVSALLRKDQMHGQVGQFVVEKGQSEHAVCTEAPGPEARRVIQPDRQRPRIKGAVPTKSPLFLR